MRCGTRIQGIIPEIESAYLETVLYIVEIESLCKELERTARSSGNERLAGIVEEAKRNIVETMAESNKLRELLGDDDSLGPKSLPPDILNEHSGHISRSTRLDESHPRSRATAARSTEGRRNERGTSTKRLRFCY